MKTILFLLIFLPAGLIAQTPPSQQKTAEENGTIAPPENQSYVIYKPKQDQNDSNYVFYYVEEAPEFPGGTAALRKFLSDNIKYPMRDDIEGKCYVRFVVRANGKITDVEIMRGIPDCPECDAETVRLIQAMPLWTPGKNNGKPVNSYYNLPVAFHLN